MQNKYKFVVDKTTHDDYIKLYKELIDNIGRKDEIIEAMTNYIARHNKKPKGICKKLVGCKCEYKKCAKCVREYFEGIKM